MIYDVGDVVRIKVRFADINGAGTNPTTVTLTIWSPSDAVTTPSPTSDGSGEYHYDLSLTASGIWRFKWAGTGAVAAVEEGTVTVRQTALVNTPPTSVTPLALIHVGLRLSGMMSAPERTGGPEFLQEGLRALNSMLDAWRVDGLMVPYVSRQEFTLIVDQQDYTIGPTNTDFTPNNASFTHSRPVRITRAGIVDVSQSDEPEFYVDVLTLDEWAAITNKGLQVDLPTALYYEPTTANDRGTIHLREIPTAANKLILYLEEPLLKVQTLTTAMILSPGYQEALETNLARRIAQRNVGKAKIDRDTILTAERSLAAIRSANHRPMLRENDFRWGRRGWGNINTGEIW